jgi:dTMP kinase
MLEKGHGTHMGTCGHPIKQCRCARKHQPIQVDAPCAKCAQASLAESFVSEAVMARFERLIGEDKAANKYGRNGLLVVFEGIDGSGKTSAVKRLAEWLNEKDYSYISTKWNSSKLLSDVLWKAKRKKLLTPMTFSLLHASDMHLRYQNIILPALAKGKVVICDRYYYTSYVRDQIRDIPEDLLDIVYKDFRKPDLIFYLKVPVKVAVERLLTDRGVGYYSSGRDVGYKAKGIEKTTEKYEEDMVEWYEKIFKNEAHVIELDCDRPLKEIAKDVKAELRKHLWIED